MMPFCVYCHGYYYVLLFFFCLWPRAAKLKPLYSCVWKSLGDACVCLVDVDVEQSPWKLTLPQELHGDGSQAASKGDLLEAATRSVCGVTSTVREG